MSPYFEMDDQAYRDRLLSISPAADSTADPAASSSALQRFPDPFRSALERIIDAYRARFADRLASVVVFGSVHRREAVPGWSDCDLDAYVRDRQPEDAAWARAADTRLREAHPDLPTGLVPPRDVACLAVTGSDTDAVRADALRFRMRYDGTRVAGQDLSPGLPPSPPSPARARAASASAIAGLRAAGPGRAPSDFPLPGSPPRRFRALARLAVLGGAYLLMARGRFRSFRCAEVLPELERDEPPFSAFLARTAAGAVLPSAAGAAEAADYGAACLAWAAHLDAALSPGAT